MQLWVSARPPKGEFKNPKSAEGCEIEGWIQIQLYKNHVGSKKSAQTLNPKPGTQNPKP